MSIAKIMNWSGATVILFSLILAFPAGARGDVITVSSACSSAGGNACPTSDCTEAADPDNCPATVPKCRCRIGGHVGTCSCRT